MTAPKHPATDADAARGVGLRGFTALAIVLTLVAMAFIKTTAEPWGRMFWYLLIQHDLPAAWLMLALLACGIWFGLRSGSSGGIESLLRGLDRRRHAVAAGLWILLCAGSVWIYHNHPLSMDEYAAVFQARVFAAGALHGQFPPDLLDNLIPKGFQNQFLMVNRTTGAVFAGYWPGFSLLLAPFVWLGIPWACNPTLVAASFLLIGRMARDLLDSPLAPGWALLFALASPVFLANGISYYAMAAHLLFNLGFAWLLLSPSPQRLFLGGLAGGFALALHNPFAHVAFALPWIASLALRGEGRLTKLAWLAAGYLPMIAGLLVDWSLWQQQVLQIGATAPLAQQLPPVQADLWQRAMRLLARMLRVLQMPDEAIGYARLGGLVKLWLWAAPMLLLLAWWGGRESRNRGIRLLGASALTTFFAYFLIRFDQGHGWGYRYFHAAWGVLPVLGAAGIVKLAASPDAGGRWTRALGAMALASLLLANGLRAWQMQDFIAGHLAQSPPRSEGVQQLVMHNGRGFYVYDLIQNDPWLRGNTVVLIVGGEDEQLRLLDRLKERLKGPVVRLDNRFGSTYAGSDPAASPATERSINNPLIHK